MALPSSTQRTRQTRAPLALILNLLLAVSVTAVSAKAHAAEAYTVDHIVEQLSNRVEQVQDLSATISFVRISARDGSKTEGTIRLEAVFPDVIRATFLRPELWEGALFILDAEQNAFTQYWPTTGQADVFALDETLKEVGGPRALIPLTPEDLFTLPSPEEFDLEIVEIANHDAREFAVVEATPKVGGDRYRLWVDTLDWLVTRIESIGPDGKVKDSADATGIKINESIPKAPLRALPPGSVVRRMS